MLTRDVDIAISVRLSVCHVEWAEVPISVSL